MKLVEKIKVLREETGAGVMEVKQVLEQFDGDLDKARDDLMSKVAAKAAKKAERTAGDGLVYSYIHNTGKIGSMILLACETDFVARNENFQALAKEIAMQVATSDYEDVSQILEDEYMRDSSKTIQDLINEMTAKLGEKIELTQFSKISV